MGYGAVSSRSPLDPRFLSSLEETLSSIPCAGPTNSRLLSSVINSSKLKARKENSPMHIDFLKAKKGPLTRRRARAIKCKKRVLHPRRRKRRKRKRSTSNLRDARYASLPVGFHAAREHDDSGLVCDFFVSRLDSQDTEQSHPRSQRKETKRNMGHLGAFPRIASRETNPGSQPKRKLRFYNDVPP